jgi:P4 family phage/plasmid primase-like protien
MKNKDSWSPFHVAADDYLNAGYLPIPLPFGKKYPPPSGIPNDVIVDDDSVTGWLSSNRQHNIGTVVPDGVVVLDIDGAAGQASLDELEYEYGKLPRTWVSYRGDPEHYHLWFTTPAGTVWPGKLSIGLDLIYRHYRYMVIPPSVHPSGAHYRWANFNGKILRTSTAYFPGTDEFADIPEKWLTLAGRGGYVRRDRANVDSRLWLREHGKGVACPQMRRVVNTHIRLIKKHSDGGLHDAMTNAVWAIVSEISTGHTGGVVELRKIKDLFLYLIEQCGRRQPGQAEAEWSRACVGAVEKSALGVVRADDPCLIEEKERHKSPDRFFDPKHGLRSETLRNAVELTGNLAAGTGGIIYRHHDGVWSNDGDYEITRRTVSLLRQRWRPSHAINVKSVIESRVPFIRDDKQDTDYLNLPNGLLDWRTGKLHPHNPNIVSTIRIPIPWNEDAECPMIDKFLGEILPNDAVELAYELLGYMLYNDNPLHKAILLYGSGRNGKGTFIRLARMLVGHSNIAAITPQDLDSSQFTAAQLHGKLANLVGDVDPKIFKSTEKFKQLTGGDYMTAQNKHKDPFVFRCRALMIAAFNALPRTADTTEGFFSRWVVVPFENFFPAGKADTNLVDKLTTIDNMQGLLRYSVGGLQQVLRRGKFTIPKSVQKATANFRRDADPMRSFIEERVCTRPPGLGDFTPRTTVYSEYTTWALLNGFHQMSAQRFYEAFASTIVVAKDFPVVPVKKRGVRGYRGILIN